MSTSVTKIVSLHQAALKFLVGDESEGAEAQERKQTIGGLLSGSGYGWLANGPFLEIINTKTGCKMGAWTFGWVLRAVRTEIVCVQEIQRPNGGLPLLAVGINCDFSGGMLCIFDFASSRVVRAINIRNIITNLHVIDSGYDIFTLPGPLRNFDGVIAVGTAGGDVFLIDICRQICDEALTTRGLNEIRDELNPCDLLPITSRELNRIEHHKEYAVRNSQHLAIHLNVVFDKSTKHFTLKGPKGDDRIHVNKEEVAVSALLYCPQLGSLLVGYNFGALQLYNLMDLKLVYTSPICDEHLPISHFAIQEPADDPRSVCYIWAAYSSDHRYPTSLPLAVMYAFCYHSKEYHEGYGFLYQGFSSAAVHYQMELGLPEGHRKPAKIRGGRCLELDSITQGVINRDEPSHQSNDDTLTLSVFVWSVVFSNRETQTFVAIFDLNQWYKEQMPSVPNVQYTSTYMLQIYLNELINSATNRPVPVLYVHVDKNSIHQFTGPQRLEEHFHPNSLTFNLTCLRENDIVFLQHYGVQKALLAQIESSGPLCLVEPAEIYQGVIGLGLLPLFIDLPVNAPVSTNQQREIILGAALENQLMGWLCKCASEWANGSFLSTGCSLDLLISWAFQRAAVLKSNCDKFCVSLFDYSQARLDNNTNILLNNCTRQLKNICTLYAYIIEKLPTYISNHELVADQYKSLQTVSVYFEVLRWLLNVGLLPECPLSSYPRTDDLERISAPYPAEMLTDFYNHRRALLKIENEQNFSSSESVLFIDALCEIGCKGKALQEQWRHDGGNGLYPPLSLQALLRTYLIDSVDLAYKHSVVIYVFLDLATTLDQEKYKPVITQLIKFPAVFKVSPSMIKITQAFWQLDHCDYNTAMGLLLDPLISSDDLKPWHHKIVLRSLVLQKQHNFALLYLQVRKPILKDDEDILSAISLYIANNMLDEAFYFLKNYTNQNEENKFMAHFLNECNKNSKLRSIIYRSLASPDEKFFLQYLSNGKEELRVYYHILRSHFLEAFESHGRTVPAHIESQGLQGQENAIPREKLIHSLKRLLPDVNRELINYCYAQKANIWQEVARPTPMSVFVHNTTENIQYKSTLIGAALAKARQTYNDETLDQKTKLGTEEMPFLRTPTATVGSKRSSAVVITPRIIDLDEEDDEVSPPSAKRVKLAVSSKLDTPLVKRKVSKDAESVDSRVATPHSILKVKSGDYDDDFREFNKLEYSPVTPKKSGLGLSPRKSLAKSPGVRFEGLQSLSSSLDNTPNLSDKVADLASPESSKSTEDVFYSPNASFEETPKAEEEGEAPKEEEGEEVEAVEARENISEEKPPSPVFSPKGRRSYKRDTTTPLRSSPRLSKATLPSVETSPEKQPALENSPKLSPVLPKLRPRKSLCRKVLESNTLNRVKSDLEELDIDSSITKTTRVEESTEVVLESSYKYKDGEETRQSSIVKKHSLTKSALESDLDTSEEYSFKFVTVEGPKLSDSMVEFLNRPDRTCETTVLKEQEEEKIEQKVTEETVVNEGQEGKSEETVLKEGDEEKSEEVIEETTFKEKGAEGEEEADESVEPSNGILEDEVMEIDYEEIDEDKEGKTEQLVYATLENSSNEVEKEKEAFDGETSNRPVDPEMNVFEVSDDLSYNNDGLTIEKEVQFEEDDLCYDQQETLENVLEENMVTVTSSLNVFEENVFNEECSSSESEEGDEEPRTEQKPTQEDEVIEIGSSSEEEEYNRSNSSEYEEEEHVSHGGNIYDSDGDYSSESSHHERHYSEISENSDDRSEEGEGCGLFEGDIITAADGEESKTNENRSSKEGKKVDSSAELSKISENSGDGSEFVEADTTVAVDEQQQNEEESKTADNSTSREEEKETLELPSILSTIIENSDELSEKVCDTVVTVDKEEGKTIENRSSKEEKEIGATTKNNDLTTVPEEKSKTVEDKTSEEGKEESRTVEDNTSKEEKKEDTDATKQSPSDFVDASSKAEPDCLDQVMPLEETERLRAGSSSVSTPKDQRGEPDVLEALMNTEKPVRTLRPRRLSTEAPSTKAPAVTLRKRSASVEETNVPAKKRSVKKEVSDKDKDKKSRNRRASSVSHLQEIPEEEGVKEKKAKSVLEGYSMDRRLTRHQVSLLKKVDPIILLDRLPFEGPPDPEEEKVYDRTSSPSSGSSSPVKAGRRLRSRSQASSNSRRSKSKTPTRVVGKKAATTPKKLETVEEPQERVTRSRTKSMSSVKSDDSNVSGKVDKRKQKGTKLPDITEEPTGPKKRTTRRNSSQK